MISVLDAWHCPKYASRRRMKVRYLNLYVSLFKVDIIFLDNYPIVSRLQLLSKRSSVEKILITKITLIKVLYLYIFDEFCWKKMLDIDLQSWIYFIAGHPAED